MDLTLNQPRTHKCVQSLHKSIRICMGVIILGTVHQFLLKKILMASKGLLSAFQLTIGYQMQNLPI